MSNSRGSSACGDCAAGPASAYQKKCAVVHYLTVSFRFRP